MEWDGNRCDLLAMATQTHTKTQKKSPSLRTGLLNIIWAALISRGTLRTNYFRR